MENRGKGPECHGVWSVGPGDWKPVVVEQRIFNPGRDYVWPIPPAELNASKNMRQNTGW